MSETARVSARGAKRIAAGHPWVFRSDIERAPSTEAGVVPVEDQRGKGLGWALWSPASEISIRHIEADPKARVDDAWWAARIGAALARRRAIGGDTNAVRLVHAEGDRLPSLVVDRYDRWLVVQLLSAGLESCRAAVVRALVAATGCEGILARNDASVRTREGLAREVTVLAGGVPDEIEVTEAGVRLLVTPRDGQKTGAFLDQRENRRLVASVARGSALDLFSYHGSFALHLARAADRVVAVDSSGAALERGARNAALNGVGNIEFVEADAFAFVRDRLKSGERYDTVVVDPPALAKNRGSIAGALRAYHDLNVHAMRLLAPNGMLFTASCSYHVGKGPFLDMVRDAAADAGRTLAIRAITGQPVDHPEVVTIPETGYLKGVLLEAIG
ncbi:MAG: class I SAM-dependent rRNA methyltransferase [Gemmatimonadetes bacterium]|nr:class I SAM-dependent rRNA methyltransferase [Gemmatimonadota bacterium]